MDSTNQPSQTDSAPETSGEISRDSGTDIQSDTAVDTGFHVALNQFDMTHKTDPDYKETRSEFIANLEALQDMQLTPPESRRYPLDEDYRFLVHVALHNVDTRAQEIGQPNGEKHLMTTLVDRQHQGTFVGFGGILLAQPEVSGIIGASSHDSGGELSRGTMDVINNKNEQASTWDYSQVDMDFAATRPVGVIIKYTKGYGRELGNPANNDLLRQLATNADTPLPVVEMEVEPSSLPTEAAIDNQMTDDDKTRSVITLPGSGDSFIRIELVRGEVGDFYHAPDRDTVSRAMKVNEYGETSNELTQDEYDSTIKTVTKLTQEGRLDQKDLETITADAAQFLTKEPVA